MSFVSLPSVRAMKLENPRGGKKKKKTGKWKIELFFLNYLRRVTTERKGRNDMNGYKRNKRRKNHVCLQGHARRANYA